MSSDKVYPVDKKNVHKDHLIVQKRKNCFEEPSTKKRRVAEEFKSITTRWSETPI